MDMYAENILDHYKNPRNQGEIKDASSSYSLKNPSCGDEMTIYLKIKDNKIQDIKFSGVGCAISQAAISILSEEIIGMALNEAEKISKKDILEMLGVPVSERRIKCALLCLITLKNAINNYKGIEKKVNWTEVV